MKTGGQVARVTLEKRGPGYVYEQRAPLHKRVYQHSKKVHLRDPKQLDSSVERRGPGRVHVHAMHLRPSHKTHSPQKEGDSVCKSQSKSSLVLKLRRRAGHRKAIVPIPQMLSRKAHCESQSSLVSVKSHTEKVPAS